MQLFYNPEALSEDRIKRTFVGRQWLLDELAALVRRQPEGAGVQHVLLVAPRGMGKTTMFLMLGFAIEESELKERWQPVRFREESYNVTDAAEFWMEALRQLKDPQLAPRIAEIVAENRNGADLESAAFALIKDWVRQHGKRLLLMVENFDDMLAQIHDEQESSRLRNALMNDGSVMLAGAATTFFDDVRGYDQPFYNFFKVYNLEALTEAQIGDLLVRRAEVEGKQGFREKLRQKAGRLHALALFTGGNPRLVLMLYAVLADAQVSDVRAGLEKLLDEVTPYFKARTERLSPQQRKILDQIAREALRINEGQSPTSIAREIRMTANQVSSQLKRMAEIGYVRAANLRGRGTRYTLSEPLFSLWYQMRFGRDARERMSWLVSFLQVWYDDSELTSETERLCKLLNELNAQGRGDTAKEKLEYAGFLVDAIRDRDVQLGAFGDVLVAQAMLGETDAAMTAINEKLKLPLRAIERISLLVLRSALFEGTGQVERSLGDLEEALTMGTEGPWPSRIFVSLSGLLRCANRLDEALAAANTAFERAESDTERVASLRVRSRLLIDLQRKSDAARDYSEILRMVPNDYRAMLFTAHLELDRGGREAVVSRLHRVVELAPNDSFEYAGAILLLFFAAASVDDLATARTYWRQLPPMPFSFLAGPLNDVFTALARSGKISFLRESVANSPWTEDLAPFLFVFDYVESGDREILEKLSPEVRIVVEDIVARIQKT